MENLTDLQSGAFSGRVETGLNRWQKYEAFDETLQVPGGNSKGPDTFRFCLDKLLSWNLFRLEALEIL